MNTREELIRGLYDVKGRIVEIVDVQEKQMRIAAQYGKEKAAISMTDVKSRRIIRSAIFYLTIALITLLNCLWLGDMKTVFVLLLLSGIALWAWKKNKKGKKLWAFLAISAFVGPFFNYAGHVWFWSVAIFAAVVAFFGVRFTVRYTVKIKNSQIASHNQEVNKQNQVLRAQYDETAGQLAQLTRELYNRTASWYPTSYYSLNAVNFFINAVENYRADTVKEMVNLFEATEEYRKMMQVQQNINANLHKQLLNQEDIKQQLKYANVLNAANLFMQAGTQAAIKENTRAVNNSAERITGAVNNVADATERLAGEARKINRKL